MEYPLAEDCVERTCGERQGQQVSLDKVGIRAATETLPGDVYGAGQVQPNPMLGWPETVERHGRAHSAPAAHLEHPSESREVASKARIVVKAVLFEQPAAIPGGEIGIVVRRPLRPLEPKACRNLTFRPFRSDKSRNSAADRIGAAACAFQPPFGDIAEAVRLLQLNPKISSVYRVHEEFRQPAMHVRSTRPSLGGSHRSGR